MGFILPMEVKIRSLEKMQESRDHMIELLKIGLDEAEQTCLKNKCPSLNQIFKGKYQNYFLKLKRKYRYQNRSQAGVIIKSGQLFQNPDQLFEVQEITLEKKSNSQTNQNQLIVQTKKIKKNEQIVNQKANISTSQKKFKLPQLPQHQQYQVKQRNQPLDADFLIDKDIQKDRSIKQARQVKQDKIQQINQRRDIENREINGIYSEISLLEASIDDYKKRVGLLIAVWFNQTKQKVIMTSLSTAFIIDSKIIVSCAHGVIENISHRPCDKAFFIPSEGRIYQSEDENFLRYEPIKRSVQYGNKPLIQDIAVLILKEELPPGPFFQLSSEPLKEQQEIQVWGYPSENKNIKGLSQHMTNVIISGQTLNLNIPRVDLSGKAIKYYHKKDFSHILVHTAPTLKGHSGSPIVQISDKKVRVVGVHTHRGFINTNEGLRMNLIQPTIMKYKQQLLYFNKGEKNQMEYYDYHVPPRFMKQSNNDLFQELEYFHENENKKIFNFNDYAKPKRIKC